YFFAFGLVLLHYFHDALDGALQIVERANHHLIARKIANSWIQGPDIRSKLKKIDLQRNDIALAADGLNNLLPQPVVFLAATIQSVRGQNDEEAGRLRDAAQQHVVKHPAP